MRRQLLSALSVFTFCGLYAQPHFGNEWINYGAQYWSFNVVQEGLFRIDSATLASAGFPLGQVDPHTIQVFGREKQVPIYVSGDSDNVFNATDFIEFYAKGNDAWLDSGMYDSTSHIANPYYSLINDTIQYFITWNTTPGAALRVELDTNHVFSGTPRGYCWYTSVYSPASRYRPGMLSSIFASTSTIGEGEGYFEPYDMVHNGTVDPSNSHTFQISTPSFTSGFAPDPQITVVEAGVNHPGGEGSTTVDHHIQVFAGAFNQLGVDDSFPGYQLNKFHFTIPYFHINAITTNVTLSIVHDLPLLTSQPAYPDRQAMAWCSIKYTRQCDNFYYANDLDFDIADEPGDPPAHLQFTFYPGTPVIYAWGNTLRRIMPVFNGSVWDAMIPADPNSNETHIFITGLGAVHPITAFTKVNGSGFFNDLAATQVDDAMVIVTHPHLMNAVLQYAAYRGGPINHSNTLVANVLELYQQFGGGINRHPLAIRRFMGYLLAHFTTKPKALFLIGKSITTAKVSGQTGARIYPGDAGGLHQLLVPTFGYPPSDALFTLGLSGDPTDFTVPVGRLAAHNEQDVLNYLAKVQTFESQPVAAWMKNILHFRGGFSPSDDLTFGAYLESFKQWAVDTCFLGHVITFVKEGNGIIQQASADSVYNLIHEGVTLMTFFAHASGGGFDITIDNPNQYQWNGRYPMIIGNSCYTGNIHLNDNSSASEVFTLPGGAGSIAFLSSVDLGISGYLAQYTEAFYKSFSVLNYGKSIGEHMRHAVNEILTLNTLSEIDVKSTAQTFTLQGDPTLILNSPSLPDFEITNADVRTTPDPVTVDNATFQVHARIRNIGCGCHGGGGQFPVALQRTLQDGTVVDTIEMHTMHAWQDTVVFHMPTLVGTAGAGWNNLEVRVDEDPNLVTEIIEDSNNVAHLNMLITSGDLLPVYPYEYAITPDAAPMLKACTGNPFAPSRTYLFQIDTTDLFNSPMMEQTTLNAPGGVVQWQPLTIYSLNNTIDSLVYFWRCTVDSIGNNGYDWHEFSFQHITNREGWGQAHYFQYKKDDYTHNVIYDRQQRDFDFLNGPRNIGCQMTGNNVNLSRWTKDLVTQEGQGCGGTPAFHVGIVDPFDFHTWETNQGHANPGHSFGNWNDTIPHGCRTRPEKYFIFRQNNPAQLTSMANMLMNSVPNGSYILVYTYRYLQRFNLDTSTTGIMAELAALGADTLMNTSLVHDSVPYIFFCQKGNPLVQHEVWGTTLTSQISSSDFVTINAHTGTILAPYAGPTYEWKALYWDARTPHASDSTRIILTGINSDGIELPVGNFPVAQDSFIFDTLGLIQQYPYLRVSGEYYDSTSTNPKPAQMRRWQLLESPVPECAIDPPLGYYVSLDNMYEGQIAHVMVAVRNISAYNMDSLLMEATVVDEQNHRHRVHYKHKAPLPAAGVLLDTISFNLATLAGANTIIIEANGLDTLTQRYDQLEQYHFNNIATLRFLTLRDLQNPMLDVTFDGMHIIDGDIVSARPEIQITLNDENPTLLLNTPGDTVNFKVFQTDPGGTLTRLHFYKAVGEYMHFVPANGPDNVSKIFFRPKYDQDGVYIIHVQAHDLSANASGDHEYTVRFEVINRPTITEVLNYPNPFTTSTRFVFTLTGRETPTAMRIQIMTIGGRVVREIPMNELGPLRVGRNITDYAWDGRDQFGDQLARGVYLYHVIAQLHGEDIEYRETSASGYFTKGFGKMYLLK